MSQPSPQVSPVAAPALPARPAQASPVAPAEAQHGTSTAAPQHPATVPANHMATPSTSSTLAPTPAPQTYVEKLNAGDRDWKWKIGLRTLLIIISFIGLGCAAWVVANFTSQSMYSGWEYDMDDGWSIPWVLITFTMSIIWSAVCIFVFFKRRSHGPLHPGAQVGVDLILWLGYIPTGMFAALAVMSVKNYGYDGIIGRYSNNGPWTYSQGNNTWVYNSTASYSSYYSSSQGRSCDSSSRSFYSSGFSSCAEIDSYVNHLWDTKNARFNAELCATVCQFIALFLHLTLFIWACVDTNRRNSRKVSKDAEKLAADIIQNMIKTGALIAAPGQAHMRPMPMQTQPYPPQMMQGYPQYAQYPQYPPQQHPQTMQQPQHFSRPLSSPHASQAPTGPLPTVPSSSNEKSAGPRFA